MAAFTFDDEENPDEMHNDEVLQTELMVKGPYLFQRWTRTRKARGQLQPSRIAY